MTILSKKNNFLFIHLHKCGGTSVERAYEDVAHWSDIVIGSTGFAKVIDDYYREKLKLTKHSSAIDVLNAVGADDYHEMLGFALVRSPFSILESFYAWIGRIFAYCERKKNIPLHQLKHIVMAGGEDADQFHFAKWGSSLAYAHTSSFNEFVEFALANRSIPLASMCRRLGVGTELEPEHIFRLDEIEDFWKTLERHLGVPLKRIRANASSSTDAPVAWSAMNAMKVRQLFQEDIERFGFEKTPPV
jgi:hypothetical protein